MRKFKPMPVRFWPWAVSSLTTESVVLYHSHLNDSKLSRTCELRWLLPVCFLVCCAIFHLYPSLGLYSSPYLKVSFSQESLTFPGFGIIVL